MDMYNGFEFLALKALGSFSGKFRNSLFCWECILFVLRIAYSRSGAKAKIRYMATNSSNVRRSIELI